MPHLKRKKKSTVKMELMRIGRGAGVLKEKVLFSMTGETMGQRNLRMSQEQVAFAEAKRKAGIARARKQGSEAFKPPKTTKRRDDFEGFDPSVSLFGTDGPKKLRKKVGKAGLSLRL